MNRERVENVAGENVESSKPTSGKVDSKRILRCHFTTVYVLLYLALETNEKSGAISARELRREVRESQFQRILCSLDQLCATGRPTDSGKMPCSTARAWIAHSSNGRCCALRVVACFRSCRRSCCVRATQRRRAKMPCSSLSSGIYSGQVALCVLCIIYPQSRAFCSRSELATHLKSCAVQRMHEVKVHAEYLDSGDWCFGSSRRSCCVRATQRRRAKLPCSSRSSGIYSGQVALCVRCIIYPQ